MPPAAKRLLLNFALAVLVLVVLGVLWLPIAPRYNGALAALAQVLSPPQATVRAEKNDLVLIYNHPALSRPASARINGLTFHGGLLLIVALVLATPHMSARHRLLWSLGLTALFLAFHVLILGFFTWALKWGAEGGSVNLFSIIPIVPTVHIIAPAVAAGTWCFRYWLPSLKC